MQAITEGLKYDALLKLARVAERPALRGPNRAAAGALGWACRRAFGLRFPRWRVLLRHSASRRADFNLFFSDVDLSLVLAEGQDAEAGAREAFAFAERLRRLVPSLGELEIHAAGEYAELQSWMARGGKDYRVLRDLRKLGWMEAVVASGRHPYHAAKAERAISRCRERLRRELPGAPAGAARGGAAVSAFLGEWLPARLDLAPARRLADALEPGFEAFCPYLGARVKAGPDRARDVVSLAAEQALALLAVAPGSVGGPDSLRRAATELRATPEIGATWRALAEIELLTLRAASRGTRFPPDWLATWSSDLEATVREARAAGAGEGPAT